MEGRKKGVKRVSVYQRRWHSGTAYGLRPRRQNPKPGNTGQEQAEVGQSINQSVAQSKEQSQPEDWDSSFSSDRAAWLDPDIVPEDSLEAPATRPHG